MTGCLLYLLGVKNAVLVPLISGSSVSKTSVVPFVVPPVEIR